MRPTHAHNIPTLYTDSHTAGDNLWFYFRIIFQPHSSILLFLDLTLCSKVANKDDISSSLMFGQWRSCFTVLVVYRLVCSCSLALIAEKWMIMIPIIYTMWDLGMSLREVQNKNIGHLSAPGDIVACICCSFRIYWRIGNLCLSFV